MNQKQMGGYLIAKIHHLNGKTFSRALRRMQIDHVTPNLASILFFVWQSPNATPKYIADRMGISKSTLTSMIDKLETLGMIQRTRSTRDRRSVHLKLLLSSEDMAAMFGPAIFITQQFFYKGFSEEDIATCERYLERILNNLEDALQTNEPALSIQESEDFDHAQGQ